MTSAPSWRTGARHGPGVTRSRRKRSRLARIGVGLRAICVGLAHRGVGLRGGRVGLRAGNVGLGLRSVGLRGRRGAQVIERGEARPFPLRAPGLHPRPARFGPGAQPGSPRVFESLAKHRPVQPRAQRIGRLPAHPDRAGRLGHPPALLERKQEGLHLGHGPAIIGIGPARPPGRARGRAGGRSGGRGG